MEIPFECNIDVVKSYEDGERWIVEGMAATTDFDLQDDIITEEAIKLSSRDLLQNSTVLHNHNTNESIGKVVESEARKGGLWLKILVSKTAPKIWQKIREGVLNKFSIRGRILEAKKQWLARLERVVRVILKMQLLEASLVALPANPKAKALRWYIEKALDLYESEGGELEDMENQDDISQTDNTGGFEMENEEGIIEEELVEAWGDDSVQKEKTGKKETVMSKSAEGKTGKKELQEGDSMKQIIELMGSLLEKEKDAQRRKIFAHMQKIAKEVQDGEKETAGTFGEAGAEEVEKAGRKISSSRLTRLKKLLDELQQIIAEVDPVDDPEAQKKQAEGNAGEGEELTKKLGALESTLEKITSTLGIGQEEPGKEKQKKKSPALVDMIKDLSKRLDAIEGIPGGKTSLDGQESLAGEKGDDKSVWKGLV